MVEAQSAPGCLHLRGISMPRHEFVFHEYTEQADANGSLPLGEDQVSIQPSLPARVTQANHRQKSEMQPTVPCLRRFEG